MKVFIGADHRGSELGNSIHSYLIAQGVDAELIGGSEHSSDDDYVDFGVTVGKKVAHTPGSRGIVICGSGVGMDIAANKIKGIRAFLGYSPEVVRSARNDDDVNVMALGSDFTASKQSEELVRIFLSTPFDASERRVRRLKKITALE